MVIWLVSLVRSWFFEYELEQGTAVGPNAFSLEEGVPELFRFFGGAVVAAASFSASVEEIAVEGALKRVECSLILFCWLSQLVVGG